MPGTALSADNIMMGGMNTASALMELWGHWRCKADQNGLA